MCPRQGCASAGVERVSGSRVKCYWERSPGSSVTPEEPEAEAGHFLPEKMALQKAQIRVTPVITHL